MSNARMIIFRYGFQQSIHSISLSASQKDLLSQILASSKALMHSNTDFFVTVNIVLLWARS